jgi:hypothetical protein
LQPQEAGQAHPAAGQPFRPGMPCPHLAGDVTQEVRQHIAHGDQTRHASELVHDEGDLRAVLAHLRQEAIGLQGFGNGQQGLDDLLDRGQPSALDVVGDEVARVCTMPTTSSSVPR